MDWNAYWNVFKCEMAVGGICFGVFLLLMGVAVGVRWWWRKRTPTSERMEELHRIVDEAEDGAIIPMTQAEIKAITPTLTGAGIFRQAIDDLRNDSVRMAEFAVAWKKWTERFPREEHKP